jgi:hypothetical protein
MSRGVNGTLAVYSRGTKTIVISTVDELFGHSLHTIRLRPDGIDADGSLTFYYFLTGGKSGIAVARPTTKFSWICLPLFGVALVSFAGAIMGWRKD